MNKTISVVVFLLLLPMVLTLVLVAQPVRAWAGIVYIRADGSVDPPTAPIQRDGDVYTLTDDITRGGGSVMEGFEIVIERNNMTLDGAGHVLRSDRYEDKGISLSGRSNVTIKNLQFSIVTCIYLLFSSNNAILGNNISNSEDGIFLQNSSCNLISGNNIRHTFEGGIKLLSSDNNTIRSNNMVDNVVSILVEQSSNNLIYHNNFIDSPYPLVDPGYTNFYDNGYPSGGNYWSDYKGIDLFNGPYQNLTGSDGIIDMPYFADRYPLIFPRSEPHLPVAEFFISSASAQMLAAESMIFNASQSLAGWNGTHAFDITEYRWDFGDGNITSIVDPIIVHTYSLARTYSVSLTVQDTEGSKSSSIQTIKVWMPTLVSISTGSSSTFVGFAVDINGSLTDVYGSGLENQVVVLYYTFSGTNTWVAITSDTTDHLGKYYVTWIPTATGYFTLKAEWTGNSTHFGANNTISLSSIPYQNQYVFSVESNSTVSALAFNTTSWELSFSVSGQTGTRGYVKVTVAKRLLTNIADVEVYLDGNPTGYSVSSQDDSWVLIFTYTHSTRYVTIGLNLGKQTDLTQWIYLLTVAAVLVTVTAGGVMMLMRRKNKPKEENAHSVEVKGYVRALLRNERND